MDVCVCACILICQWLLLCLVIYGLWSYNISIKITIKIPHRHWMLLQHCQLFSLRQVLAFSSLHLVPKIQKKWNAHFWFRLLIVNFLHSTSLEPVYTGWVPAYVPWPVYVFSKLLNTIGFIHTSFIVIPDPPFIPRNGFPSDGSDFLFPVHFNDVLFSCVSRSSLVFFIDVSPL